MNFKEYLVFKIVLTAKNCFEKTPKNILQPSPDNLADKVILYIGAFAFSLYTNDYTIELPEGDYDAGKTPASNNTVTSVTIPSDVLEVQKYAFYNCTALEKVNFLVSDKGDSCKIIREYAFAKAEKLNDINLENINMIGNNAFEGCKNLTTADLNSCYAIGKRAFANCTALKYVDITALRNAGEQTFINCRSLTTIDNGRYSNFSEGMFINSGLKSCIIAHNYLFCSLRMERVGVGWPLPLKLGRSGCPLQ